MKLTTTLLFGSLILIANMGCGGGGLGSSGSHKGTGKIQINWPVPTRLIPSASQSIVVNILQDSIVVGTKMLVRPAGGGLTTATFEDLPIGSLTLTATAYPTTTGTGVAQATGTTTIITSIENPFSASVTMNTRIAGFLVNGHSASIPTSLEEFGTAPITVAAIDSTGSIVLTRPQDLSISDNSNHVSYSNGVLSGLIAGSGMLTIRDLDSNTFTNSPVTVTPFADGLYQQTMSSGPLITVNAVSTITAPNLVPTQWQVVAPAGVNLPDQQLLSSSAAIDGSSGSIAMQSGQESQGLMRNYWFSLLNPSLLSNPQVVTTRYNFSLRTKTRTLMAGRPAVVPADLTNTEKTAYLAETIQCNYTSQTVKDWMNLHNLWKQSGETTIELAKRVCDAMKSDFSYAIIPATTASDHVNLKQGDCGGLALVIEAVLRANGIPCRFLWGGVVHQTGGPLDPNIPANWNILGHHATLEMWHRTAGWVRVDGSNSVNFGATNVGKDDDTFVAFSSGEEFDFTSSGWPWGNTWALQVPSYGANGSGSFSGYSLQFMWSVTRN